MAARSTTRKSKSLSTKATELAMAVPQVVAHRVTRMAMSGPMLSERDRKEFELMGAEKTDALTESWNAMAAQAVRSNQALAASWFQSFWSLAPHARPSASSVATQIHNAALGVLGKGLEPVHRKAMANAKRLARTRLR